ncbi:hypothetical protein JCM19046_3379 [Bacillus sp. JCM 19046]|nr:hypothetical protein JCM19045_878 [Bacillus sp. JCM 19045]GAF18783.1 hypothetical protein JCM19046_3379 [Bacillus sp. JCM 19046]
MSNFFNKRFFITYLILLSLIPATLAIWNYIRNEKVDWSNNIIYALIIVFFMIGFEVIFALKERRKD